eukprot:1291728-Rhodomonas_salina.1
MENSDTLPIGDEQRCGVLVVCVAGNAGVLWRSSGQGLLRLAPRLDALKEAHSDGEDSETGTESHP